MRTDKSRAPTQVGQPAIRVKIASVESLLRAAGWSVAELSRQAHMDHSAVARLLRGENTPGNRSIAGLLHAFGAKFPPLGFEDLFELVADSGALAAVEDEIEGDGTESGSGAAAESA